MREPNKHCVYEAEVIEEVARTGRAFASIELAQCLDGLFRYSLHMMWSYGGFGGPISDHGEGYATVAAAKEAALNALVKRFPAPRPDEPQSVHDELRELRRQIEIKFRGPTLF